MAAAAEDDDEGKYRDEEVAILALLRANAWCVGGFVNAMICKDTNAPCA